MDKLKNALKPLLGLRCSVARIALDDGLRLCFEAETDVAEDDVPQIVTNSASWRIMRNGEVLAGEYDVVDWERGLEDVLAELPGRILTDIDLWVALADVRLTFDGCVVVEFLDKSREYEAWEVRLPDGNFVEVGPGGEWELRAPTAVCGELSREEHRFFDYAQAFGERWRNRVPRASPAGRWGQCACFRLLHGKHHFWDFGVCANPASTFDGKLVGTKSGCPQWAVSLTDD